MSKRGRPSLGDLTTVEPQGGNVLEIYRIPDAPYHLTDEQAAVWRIVANDPGLPGDWFTQKNYDLLALHTVHVVNGRRIGRMIEVLMAGKEVDVKAYDDLLRMHERESRAVMATMTQMRTTQQALFHNKTKLKTGNTKKLWD
jgi:hypothetical protein